MFSLVDNFVPHRLIFIPTFIAFPLFPSIYKSTYFFSFFIYTFQDQFVLTRYSWIYDLTSIIWQTIQGIFYRKFHYPSLSSYQLPNSSSGRGKTLWPNPSSCGDLVSLGLTQVFCIFTSQLLEYTCLASPWWPEDSACTAIIHSLTLTLSMSVCPQGCLNL